VVALEVRRGLISEDAAASEYGVVVEDGEVDAAATEERREEIRAVREDGGQFDYGALPDYDDLAAQIAEKRKEFNARYK